MLLHRLAALGILPPRPGLPSAPKLRLFTIFLDPHPLANTSRPTFTAMAEALGLVASIIAVVQASDAIIKICKGYIDSVNDYPSDLRRVLLEVSSLKGIFDNLEFLHDTDVESSLILTNIGAKDGPIEGCRRVIADLRRQFPTSETNVEPSTEESSRKRRKIKDALGRLAWPLRQTKVLGLLNELSQYKSTITTAFSAELVYAR